MNKIEFSAWEDKPFIVQLEPEALEFSVNPDTILTFIAITHDPEFIWSMRYSDSYVQLYPELKGKYEIQVFENGKLIY
jgi:hypothetical protein